MSIEDRLRALAASHENDITEEDRMKFSARVLARIGIHPLSNCGPLMLRIPLGEPCPTCGVPAGSEPTAEELAELRKLWPTYPRGFWTCDPANGTHVTPHIDCILR